MKAVILAGGLGTRISEETYLKPKPMIQLQELAFELLLMARGDSLHHQKYQLMSQRSWQ